MNERIQYQYENGQISQNQAKACDHGSYPFEF